MKVTHLPSDSISNPSPLPVGAVKPGRVVRLPDLNTGRDNFYLVTKTSEIEAAQMEPSVRGCCILVNLETGRLVIKPRGVMVVLTSATAETYDRDH